MARLLFWTLLYSSKRCFCCDCMCFICLCSCRAYFWSGCCYKTGWHNSLLSLQSIFVSIVIYTTHRICFIVIIVTFYSKRIMCNTFFARFQSVACFFFGGMVELRLLKMHSKEIQRDNNNANSRCKRAKIQFELPIFTIGERDSPKTINLFFMRSTSIYHRLNQLIIGFWT